MFISFPSIYNFWKSWWAWLRPCVSALLWSGWTSPDEQHCGIFVCGCQYTSTRVCFLRVSAHVGVFTRLPCKCLYIWNTQTHPQPCSPSVALSHTYTQVFCTGMWFKMDVTGFYQRACKSAQPYIKRKLTLSNSLKSRCQRAEIQSKEETLAHTRLWGRLEVVNVSIKVFLLSDIWFLMAGPLTSPSPKLLSHPPIFSSSCYLCGCEIFKKMWIISCSAFKL